MPEWLIEQGIAETRAVLVEAGEIVEARVELEGALPAGSVLEARLRSVGTSGRNAVAESADGTEYLLPQGAGGASEGAAVLVEVTRAAIPGDEPWKRALARLTGASAEPAPSLAERLGGTLLPFPAPRDQLEEYGWGELIEEARSGDISFAGGSLRVSPTPAMTLIDVDGYLPPDRLAVLGAAAAARAIRRLDIGGSIGIDLPTSSGKAARMDAAAAIDSALPQPFERTAVNGFGFVQIVRPRSRASLVELASDRAAFEARALLRRAALEPPGAKRLVAAPPVAKILQGKPAWVESLAAQVGGAVSLRADADLPISGAYAEPA